MAVFLGILHHLSILLAVFLTPLLVFPLAGSSTEFPRQILLLFLVLLGASSWILQSVAQGKIRIRKNPLNLPILAFSFSVLLSLVFSLDMWSSVFGFYGRFADSGLLLLSLLLLYFLIVQSNMKAKTLLWLLLLSFAAAGALGMLSQFEIIPLSINVWEIGAALAVLAGPLYLLEEKGIRKALQWILLLLISAFILFLDDGSLLFVFLVSLVAGLLFFLWRKAKKGFPLPLPRALLGVFLVSLAGILLFVSFWDAPQKPLQLSQDVSWSIAANTLGDNPKQLLLGSGPGTFALDFSKERPVEFNETPEWQVRFSQAGNAWAELLATQGILGFLSLGAVIGIFFLGFFLRASRKKEANLLVFGTAIIAAALLQLLFWQTVALSMLFWVLLAAAILSWELPTEEQRIRRGVGKGGALAWGVLALLLLFFGARTVLADLQYVRAQQEGNAVQRLDAAKNAVDLNPFRAEYKIFLSKLYLARTAEELQKPESQQNQEQLSRDVQLAIAYLKGDEVEGRRIKGATELSPNWVAPWETTGILYREIRFASGALDWGAKAFSRAIELEPTNPVLYTELGKLFVVREDYESAKKQFNKALELKPDFAAAARERALLAEKEGNTASAISQMRELALRNPGNVEVLFQLGRLYYNNGEIEDAAIQFRRVLLVAPSHSNARYALALALEKQGSFDLALKELEQVLQLNPGNQNVLSKIQALQESE